MLNPTPSTRLPGGIPSRPSNGFALVVTLTLMVLLSILALGMLSLSTVALRSSSQETAMQTARANSKIALMLAIGELQGTVGSDGAITAPASILDSDPQSPQVDGVKYPHLTGVWQARSESLGQDPDYDKEASFERWLVSNSDENSIENMDFVRSGQLEDEVTMVAATGSTGGGEAVAGRVKTENGALAWWVGDENCKARINFDSEIGRDNNPSTGDLMAGSATPGAYGLKALDGFDAFPANTAESDKLITLGLLKLIPGAGSTPKELFHQLTPYSQSVLANVTTGSLRKDLSLFLERGDIEWLEGWGRAEGASGLPSGPLRPE